MYPLSNCKTDVSPFTIPVARIALSAEVNAEDAITTEADLLRLSTDGSFLPASYGSFSVCSDYRIARVGRLLA